MGVYLVLTLLTPPPSQLKQLRQQLSTTQRLLDSYAAQGTAGDCRPTLTPALALALTLTPHPNP